jgi:hypothetical protein
VKALNTFWAWWGRLDSCRGGEIPALIWDIETPGLDPTGPTLCVGWQLGKAGVSVHWGNMLEAGDFLDQLRPGQVIVAHNAKYEAQSLIARGIDPRQFVWWDTMLGEWVKLANNPHGLSLGLDDTAQRYGCEAKDFETDQLIKAGKVLEVTREKLTARNAKDVEDTAAVFHRQIAELTEAQFRLTIVRSMMAIELAHIELAGMGLDPERVAAECERNAAEIREHEDALREITKGANPKSVNEMAPVLYGMWPADTHEDDTYNWSVACDCRDLAGGPPSRHRKKDKRVCPQCGARDIRGEPLVVSLGFKEDKDTRTKPSKSWPAGKPSIAREVMAELAKRARTPRQKTWAQHYLALTDAISERDKNLAHFAEVCANGAVIYAELHQGVTATHRLSCRSKPNPAYRYGCQLQNVPRHLKGCLVPKRKGWLAASVDQSQAEFRGAVWLGDDQRGRHDIMDPRFDAHLQSGQIIQDGARDAQKYNYLFDRYKAGDKSVLLVRQDGKPHTFKPLFGGSSGTDAERAYYKWFGDNYDGITTTQAAWDAEVQRTGKYVAPTGMVFHWDTRFTTDWKGRSRMTNHMGRSLYSIVRNLPIQYFATGELAMVSTLCLLYECRERALRYECVMLIHDDTSGEVHPDDLEAWHDACGNSYGEQTYNFLASVYDVDYDIELAAESKAGVRFGSGDARGHAFLNPITDEDRLQMKIAAKAGGARVPNVKAGTHIALINAIVDLGTQPGSAAYPAPKRKLYIGFEFPGIQVEFKQENGTVEKAPARLGTFKAASMHEKAGLRRLVESARGVKFATDAEASAYDLKDLVGSAVMVPVVHKVVADKTYANTGDPVPLPEGFPNPYTLAGAPHFYDTDAHDPTSFAALPEFLQEMINKRIIYSNATKSQSVEPVSGGLPDMGQDDDKKLPF